MKVYIFLAPGFEEAECIDVADILQRAGMTVRFVAINDEDWVTGARGFTLRSSQPFTGSDLSDAALYYIPGGQPGAKNLAAFEPLGDVLRTAHANGRMIAAICAGPTVLKAFGLTEGIDLTSHSSVRDEFDPKHYKQESVVFSNNIITARGLGPALTFALDIVTRLISSEEANRISLAIENGPFHS